jgi:tight adherence protein C
MTLASAALLIAVFLATVLSVVGAWLVVTGREPAIRRRVDELAPARPSRAGLGFGLNQEDQPLGRWRWVADLGDRVPLTDEQRGELAERLTAAGYRHPAAPYVFTGLRVLLAAALPLPLLLTIVPGIPPTRSFVILAAAAALGFVLPGFVLGRLVRRRQTRITDALPDALDLLVVCVEAGLGLNQALVRVGEEIRNLEPALTEELNLVNLEMRAGKSRADALRNLARRTQVDELASLVSMLVQTDKFGTSVAKSLRVFSDGMRTRRRQRAEEAAAKTTIKLVFPLATCILPALFVVVLGPAALHIFEDLVGNV